VKRDEFTLLREAAIMVSVGRAVYMREFTGMLGIPEKRAVYILQKWADKGWYDHSVNVMAGWLTDKGMEQAILLTREKAQIGARPPATYPAQSPDLTKKQK